MFYGSRFRNDSGRGYGLMLLALLVVLVPSICLVWLMNRALQNERVAVQQKLIEAYRGHLTLAQDRLQRRLHALSADLESAATNPGPAQLFCREVLAGRADAVICFDPAGHIIYPLPAEVKHPVPNDEWNEAERLEVSDPSAAAAIYGALAKISESDVGGQALQAEARCLLRTGNTRAAAAIWEELSTNPKFYHVSDRQGRLIAPAATLMLLRSKEAQSSATNLPALCDRLARQLDYTNAAMPSSQRRFLLHELAQVRPDASLKSLLAAEGLAASLVENGSPIRPAPGEPAFRPGPDAGLWQFASEHGLVATAHYESNLATWLEKSISPEALPSDVMLTLRPARTGPQPALASISAGPSLPGWNLAVTLKQPGSITALSQQRVASYIWIGLLALVTAGILAALMLHLVRRQLALNRLRTDLVANVSHELKTPLSSMRLLVDTLLNAPRLDQPATREYLELIAHENQRLSRLIDNFLTFSRIERNRYQFTFQTIEAAIVVENAVQAVRERFNNPTCHFKVYKPAPEVAFVGDADGIVTALVNLLDNAWKYSGDQKSIELSAVARNGRVVFSVRDNGEGIPNRDLKKIFRRFYQVDQRLSRSGGGCGLGLSIVQFIMRAHKGSVEVESEPGRGSTFKLVLPAVANDSRPATGLVVNGSTVDFKPAAETEPGAQVSP